MHVDPLESAASGPASGPASQHFSPAIKLAFVAACYFVIGKFGLQFAFLHESASAIWPATGLAFASILLWGFHLWPAIFLGAFLVNVTTAGGVLTALMIACGNTLEAVVGAWLTIRYAHGRNAFSRPRDVVRFWLFACVVATFVAAAIGVTSLCLNGVAGWNQWVMLWRTWWLGDAVGGFVGAAVILLLAASAPPSYGRRRALEALIVFLFIILLGMLVFSKQLLHQTLSVLPALMWAAFRLGRRETAVAVLVVAVIGTWGTLRGTGPFAHPSINESLLMLQSFMAVIAVTHMTIAAVVAERQRAVANLRAARDDLERRVNERTVLLSNANQALREEMVERRLAEDRVMAAERQRADSMRDLAVFVQAAQEEERQRVARELHDDLGQRLAALRLNMQMFEQELSRSGEPRRKRIEQLMADVDRMIAEVRRLSYNLRPVALDDFGLTVALQMLCKDFEKLYKINTHLQVDDSMSLPHDAQVDIALYRVAQGALANVARHAGARNVSVSMSGVDGSAVLRVTDDGHGFDVLGVKRNPDRRTGLGLIGMRERAEMLGGKFTIESSAAGTTVEVAIPIATGS